MYNFHSPIPMWLGGIQLVALNFQTSDSHMALHQAFFSQTNHCGYVLKPKVQMHIKRSGNTICNIKVMRGPDHVLYKRFNPFKKDIEGLHSTLFELRIIR